MVLRWLAWTLGALLVLGAGLTAAWQVQVDDGASTSACGSVVDVVSGRVDWRQWWAADVAEDPAIGGGLFRTERCPDAENRRLLLVAGLVLSAVAAVALGEFAHRRSNATPAAPSGSTRLPADRLRALGRQVMVLGALLTVAGTAAVGLLLANPDATLFLSVGRPVVALLGALALLPAVGLVTAGRALDLLGRTLATTRSADAPE